MAASRNVLLALSVGVALLVAGVGALAVATPLSDANPSTPPVVVTANDSSIERLHAAGLTGDGVTVGVVGVTGFDVDHPTLADQVVAARSFAPQEGVENGGRNSHGTAAASLVARTAPDSRLVLATFDTADGYARAVEWMHSQGVDVVVAPVTFYGKPDDGTSQVATVAKRAVERGVVFVAPVGNLGRSHWSGRYRPVGGGVHRFEDGTRNYIQASDGDRLRLWLSWDRDHRSDDYTAELYWTNGTARRLVARSQPFPADDVPNERIVARLKGGAYYVRVTGPANATGAELTLESPTHALQFRSRTGSIAPPATAAAVLAVGAYDRDAERVRPYSSAGPTGDGRVGVDVVAPDGLAAATKPNGFNGSSAAAPYVAGIAALMLEANEDRAPRRIELELERSARDLRTDGPDVVSGYGLVRAEVDFERDDGHSNAD